MNITAVATCSHSRPGLHCSSRRRCRPRHRAPKPLDLRAPDITKLYTQRQLERLIAKMEADFIEKIEVEGARVPSPEFTPRVWPGIAAPFWALFNPTQAWRIFAPIPPDQARQYR